MSEIVNVKDYLRDFYNRGTFKATIEVEVNERGQVEATLSYNDGPKFEGHGDHTGSLYTGDLLAPLVRKACARAEQTRRWVALGPAAEGELDG